jgi:hypothetical protein
VPKGSKVLEFGSGKSTTILTRRYDVTSVEDDPAYVGACRRSRYVHAPLVAQPRGGMWYDANVVRSALAGKRFSCVIVDGPRRQWQRHTILHHLDAIDLTGFVFVDDLQRQFGVHLARGISRHVGRPFTVHYCDERRQTRWGTKSYATIEGSA